ncbi:MAG: T9SS C-terminal target domain-containing protein [Bacteroidetes bacterium]|nr:MAG: T9SS C-terminal target domain-containing protein [Bacteroidota bacterium]
MKKLLCGLALMTPVLLNAQITIDSTDFAVKGDTVAFAVDSFPGYTVGGSGMQTWDFSNLTIETYDTLFFKDTIGQPGNQDFPNANMVMISSNATTYLNKSLDSLSILGFYGDPFGFGMDISLQNNPPIKWTVFPATYLTVYDDTSGFSIGFDGATLGISQFADSVRVDRTVYSHVEFDGYGTVTTPAGAFDVLRQYVFDITIDSIWIKVPFLGWQLAQPVPGMFDTNPVIDSVYTYRWIAKGEKYPIAEATADTAGGNIIEMKFRLNNNLFVVNDFVTDAGCGTMCNGAAKVSGLGGTPPYSYQWDGNASGQTVEMATGLCPGVYSVTVTDAAMLTAVTTVTVGELTVSWGLSMSKQDATCGGCSNGEATAFANGGITPYTYQWSNGQTTQTATGLAAGSYSVTVTDGYGCSATGSVSVNEPPASAFNGIQELVSLYPNPSYDVLYIKGLPKNTIVHIEDISGKTVRNIKINSPTQEVDVSSLARGMYIAKWNTGTAEGVLKLLKE